MGGTWVEYGCNMGGIVVAYGGIWWMMVEYGGICWIVGGIW